MFKLGTGPLPHPATQREYADWVAGWGSGLVPKVGRMPDRT